MLLYLGAFCLGSLLYVPGLVFTTVAVAAFDLWPGAALALVGSWLTVTVSFVVVRGLGGRLLTRFEHPLVRRALAHLDERPLRTVIALRTVFWASPALNYALALSSIRFRPYLVGSIIGLTAPVLGAAVVLHDVLG